VILFPLKRERSKEGIEGKERKKEAKERGTRTHTMIVLTLN